MFTRARQLTTFSFKHQLLTRVVTLIPALHVTLRCDTCNAGMSVSTRVGIVPPCRLTPRVRSRHGGTFPTRGDAILRNVKPVIPGVLVARGKLV